MYTFHVADVCLWCHCTCMFAFYCSSHLAGSVSLADSVKSMHQLISHLTEVLKAILPEPTSDLHQNILQNLGGPISVVCRFNIISMSGRYNNRHRTNVNTRCKMWAARDRTALKTDIGPI